MKTPSAFHKRARKISKVNFDHSVLVLDNNMALQISFPRVAIKPTWVFCIERREPHVIRPLLSEDEREKLVEAAKQLVG